MRGLYKDIIWLMNCDTLINRGVLGDKGETRFPDISSERVSLKNQERKNKLRATFHPANRDILHYCGDCEDDFTGLNSGRGYTEVREYFNEDHNAMIIFKFINRVTPTEQKSWTEQIQSKLGQRRSIDFLLINSALWDINRSGPWAHLDFHKHLDDFIANVLLSVPNELCFWLTTPPIAEETNSKGMTIDGLDQQNFLSRYNVLNLDKIASLKFRDRGFQVIDLYYSLQSQIAQRNNDGIHWSPQANRLITNKVLTNISLALGHKLPGRIESPALERLKKLSGNQKQEMEKSITLKFGRLAAKNINKSLKQEVSFQVSRQWRRKNVLSRVGCHRDNMSSKIVPYAQRCNRLEIPPLDSFVIDNQQQNFPVLNRNQSQLPQSLNEMNYLDSPQGQFQNPGPLHFNQILPDKDENRGLSEFLQNNCPLGPPQIFDNTHNPAYANGPVPYNVFGNVPNLLNPAMILNNGQNLYQERYANGLMPNNVFQNVPNLLNPAMTLNNGQNFHQEQDTFYNCDSVNPGPGFLAFDDTSVPNSFFNGPQMMSMPPFGRGHSTRRGGRRRNRLYERGGLSKPY